MYLLFDIPVVLTHRQPDWSTWSRLGTCVLAESSFAELQYLTNRATEPQIEQAARAFLRVYPEIGWQISSAQMAHPALQPKAGQALSKRTRLLLELGHCAYGLAQQHPNQLIIVVSQTQTLIARLQALQVINLCAIPGPILRQWARFGELPEVVTTAQTRLAQRGPRTPSNPEPAPDAATAVPTLPINPARPPHSQQPPALVTVPKPSNNGSTHRSAPSTAPFQTAHSTRRSAYPSPLTQVRQFVLAMLALAIAGGLLLKLIAPEKFEQLWQSLVNLGNVTAL